MSTDNTDQPPLNTNENTTNPSTSIDFSTNNQPINTLSADESTNNPFTIMESAAAHPTDDADSNISQPFPTGTTAPSSAVAASDASNESETVQSPYQEEKSTSPTTTNSDNQVADTQLSSTNTTSNNDVTQSESSKTPVSTDTQSEIFPPASANTIEDQELFNETARAAFSKPTDQQANTSASDSNTLQSTPSNVTGTNKSKKSPAPLINSSFVDAKKAQSPADTSITINEPLNSAPISGEQKSTFDEEPQLVSPPPITTPSGKQSSTARLRPSPRAILIFAFTLLVPLIQLIIGWHYADDCPIRWRIPHYLVVSGVVGIIMLFLPIVVNLLKFSRTKQPNNPSAVVNCAIILLSIITLVLSVFLVGWFIAGCLWVGRVFNKVQFTNPRRTDYCHPVLYRFAYWLLLLTLIFNICCFYRGCRQALKPMNSRNKGELIPVPTSEP